jgi:microcystin-dependent protein
MARKFLTKVNSDSGERTPPIAAMLDYAGSADPDAAWMICDGRAISRTTYAALFALISTTYGAGNGSTTFNIPDTRGRGTIGSGTGAGLTARTRGATGGEETHVLTLAENGPHTHAGPSHTHTTPDHVHAISDHAHGAQSPYPHFLMNNGGLTGTHWAWAANTSVGGAPSIGIASVSGASGPGATQSGGGATTGSGGTGATSSSGSGTAHNNMQPWLAVPKIIRVL